MNFAESQEGTTALMTATQNNHVDCIRTLIQAGANVNATGQSG